MARLISWVLLGPLLWAAGGCNLVFQHYRPGQLDAVQTESTHPRAGNVYLVRGFVGIFSLGMDKLQNKIEEAGIRANVYQDAQTGSLAKMLVRKYAGVQSPEPVVLIGHSYGADDAVKIARELNKAGIAVDLLVTLDPVMPDKVPKNVKRTYNLYRSNGVFDTLPWLRGIPLKPEVAGAGEVANVDIRVDRPELMEPGTDHFTIDKNEKVERAALAEVLKACPPRETWLAVGKAAPAGTKLSAAPAPKPARLESPSTRPLAAGGPEVNTPAHD